MAESRITAMNEDTFKNSTVASNVVSSIWERLPYNIGMELHHCKSAVILDNDNSHDHDHDHCHAAFALRRTETTMPSTCNCCNYSNYCSNHQYNSQQSHFPPTITTTRTMTTMTKTTTTAATSIPPSVSLERSSLTIARRHLAINDRETMEKDDELDRSFKSFPILLNLEQQNMIITDDDKQKIRHHPLVDEKLSRNLKNQWVTMRNCYSLSTTCDTNIDQYSQPTTIVEQSDIRCSQIYSANSSSPTTATTTTTSTTTPLSPAPADTDTILSQLKNEELPRKFYPGSSSSSSHHLVEKLQIKFRKDKLPSLVFMYLLVHIFSLVSLCWAARLDASSNCTFPQRWEGSWFLSGYQQSIHIKGSQFSYRGKCTASDGNKYLIVDEKGCHRCLVIYEKHKNVLQYKESECEGDSMYMHQSNPSAMAMRSVLKSDHRGGAHPNSNGHSRLSSSDQYIMRSNDDMNDYFCKGRETLQNLCDQIPGDALLFSLFRESAEPVKCPLKGPFIFTYNRGHGECKNPVSNIDSCTEDSRLLLSFQACHDVQGTESTVEELTCLATWKDGNSRYLVGLVSHHHAISNEERYRCFVYEKISTLMGSPAITSSKDAEYKLAQSGDATCNGLDSAEVGSRIMSLRKPPPAERCDFPVWFKGPRHWHALMGNAVYNYHPNDGSMHIIKPNGYMETRALCEQINKQTSTEMMAVVHYTTGCQSGFMCMMFYRRDTHVIEIQTGKQASRLEDACAPDHFDINKMPYITLLASNPDPQICPLEGLYNLRGAIGPPFISSRHKRNHNNKGHSQHGHHHMQQHESNSFRSTGGGGSGTSRKRHSTLSFRESEEISHSSWMAARSREIPIRNRRNAINDDIDDKTDRRRNKNNTTHLNYGAADIDNISISISNSSSTHAASAAAVSNHLSKLLPPNSSSSGISSSIHRSKKQQQQLQFNSVAVDSNSGSSSNKKLQQMKEHQNHLYENYHQKSSAVHENSETHTTVNTIISDNKNSNSNNNNNNNIVVRNGEEVTIAKTSMTLLLPETTTTMRTTLSTLSMTAAVTAQQRSRRDAPGCIVNYKAQRQLWIGCSGPNLIDVRPQCNDDGDEEYSCHGSWSENGTVYVIARHKGTKHGVCISYRQMEGTTAAAKLVIGDACYRGILKPPEHHLVANLTVFGKCGDTSSASTIHSNWLTTIWILTIGFILLPITMLTIR